MQDPAAKTLTEAELAERLRKVALDLTKPGGPFQMAETVEAGSVVRTYDREPRTLREVLVATKAFADRDAIIYQDERLTFAEQYSQVARLAHVLRDEFGVAAGARIAIACRNYPEWIIVFWAAQALGATLVPLNAWLTGSELIKLIEEIGPQVLFADKERLERIGGASIVPAERCIAIRAAGHAAARSFDELVGGSDACELPDAEVNGDLTATILFTSGTTGRPKAVPGTHRNHVTALLNRHLRVVARRVLSGAAADAAVVPSKAEVKLMAYPLFHVSGISTMYAAAYNGHGLALMYKWDTAEAIRIIEAEKVTELSGPPLVIQNIVDAAAENLPALASVATLGCGGASAPLKLMKQVEQIFGGRVVPRTAYGMTETNSGIIALDGEELVRNPDAIGRPSPTIDVRIIDEDGNEVSVGDPGELTVRGAQIFSGYLGEAPYSPPSFINGWFRTGDKASIDANGIIRIVGRIKDIVIRGGENIQCVEVEICACDHPAVIEAAAVGVPHPTLGEELVLVAALRAGTDCTETELRAFIGERLAAFKVPVAITLTHDPLPRTASGKIAKQELGPLVPERSKA